MGGKVKSGVNNTEKVEDELDTVWTLGGLVEGDLTASKKVDRVNIG